MSELSPRSRYGLQDLGSRATHYGLFLAFRRNPETGEMSTVGFDEAGATEVNSNNSSAYDVYAHPSVTAGFETVDKPVSLWDEALDAYNLLDAESQQWALNSFKNSYRGYYVAPSFLMEAVKRQRGSVKELDRAA